MHVPKKPLVTLLTEHVSNQNFFLSHALKAEGLMGWLLLNARVFGVFSLLRLTKECLVVLQISAFVRPAWIAMLGNPEVQQSWARFSTHKPRDDGLRPESNLLDLEGEWHP